MGQELSKRYQQHFLAHPRWWACVLLLSWFGSNAFVLASTKIMEINRDGHDIAFWKPLCWELSSACLILLLIPVGISIHDRWLAKFSLKICVGFHLILTLPFSLLHVGGMVMIRKFCYWAMGVLYHFGHIPSEILYEYRKDAQTYLTLLILVFGFRLLYRRLQGEASYLTDEEEKEADVTEEKPEILLIKKLGREFLIKIADIEWIEASGNYANLHVHASVYPMRITMDKLEKMLPTDFVRIHRSTIVNLRSVQQLEALDSGDHQVTMDGGKALVLSRRYRDHFKNLLSL